MIILVFIAFSQRKFSSEFSKEEIDECLEFIAKGKVVLKKEMTSESPRGNLVASKKIRCFIKAFLNPFYILK